MVINIFANILSNINTNIFDHMIVNTSINIIANIVASITFIMFAIMVVDIFANMFHNIVAVKTFSMIINMFEKPMKQRKQRPVYFEFGVRRPVMDDWAIASRLVNSVPIIRLDDEEIDMYTAIETVKKNTKKYD